MLDIALSHCIQGDPETSEKILNHTLLACQFNLGWHLMRRGRLKEGMEGLVSGRFLNCFGSPPIKGQIWDGSPLEGKNLLLRCEGGRGDEIINIRFAKDFKNLGAKVLVQCSEDLIPLFKTLNYIDGFSGDYDFWVPAMSAPLVLNYEYENLSGQPYIPRDPLKLDGKFKVGLKYSGNPQFEHEQHRKFPRELMDDLKSCNATFYNLQKEETKLKMDDWLDTAKIISGLDLVITSCTGIAHLSGAMGIPTWVLVPIMPYYIWALPGNKSPWYDSVTLYRQEKYGSWIEPFEKIRSDLNDLCESR